MDNRILVAAARGARLQYWDGYSETWRNIHNILWAGAVGSSGYIRTHPDDTELLYCKVGRALRKAAENPPCNLVDAAGEFCDLLNYQIDHNDWLFCRCETDTETRRMFLLMLAEELSYEVLE